MAIAPPGAGIGNTGFRAISQPIFARLLINPVLPNPPVIGAAVAGGTAGTATINFTPPAFNGGNAITSYTATSSPGGITGTAAASPISMTGLLSATAYTFTVTATNAMGISTPSAASNSITTV